MIYLLLINLLFNFNKIATENLFDRILVVVSIDGFKVDYLKNTKSPFLSKLYEENTSVKRFKPVFISETFPNHISIATGLYEKHHGFVRNTFWHEKLNQLIKKNTLDEIPNVFPSNALPFWIINQLNGGKSACRQYPTSNYDFDGKKCSNTQKFSTKTNATAILDEMIEIIQTKQENLFVLYFDEVDKAGHKHGTTSTELHNSLEYIDGQIKRLYDFLMKEFENKFDLIILSDHGMKDIQCIDIENSLVENKFRGMSDGPVFTAYKQDGEPDSVVTSLKNSLSAMATANSFKIYLKNEIPDDLNFKGLNTPDILLLANVGVYIKLKNDKCRAADHGYSANDNKDMLGLFIGVGRSFRAISIEEAETVDVFNAICRIMRFEKCPKNDGSTVIADTLFSEVSLAIKLAPPIIIFIVMFAIFFWLLRHKK